MAVSGDRPLLLNGVQTVINDRLMHPRTAIGIDVDGHKLLFLVIDGRSAYSRGYTMVELATMMRALGAESALNFDGGGSSTLYSRKVTGEMGVINEPSTDIDEPGSPGSSARSPTGWASSTTASSRRSCRRRVPTPAPTPLRHRSRLPRRPDARRRHRRRSDGSPAARSAQTCRSARGTAPPR